MDKDLVVIQNNQAVTSSRKVAEKFEKRHDHVVRDIDNLKGDVPNFGEMFYECNIPDSYGRPQRAYYINKKGFQLLAMGFTGSKAIKWKLEYIDTFEAMDKQLREQKQVPKLTPNPKYRSRMIGTAIRDIGKTAESMEAVFGVRHSMALNCATDLIGSAYGFDVDPVKKLIPAEENPDSLNPAKIGTELGGVSARKVNKLLEKAGFQCKVGGDWKLTDRGKQYGSALPYTNNRNGHKGYRVMWSEKVIPLLKGSMA